MYYKHILKLESDSPFLYLYLSKIGVFRAKNAYFWRLKISKRAVTRGARLYLAKLELK